MVSNSSPREGMSSATLTDGACPAIEGQPPRDVLPVMLKEFTVHAQFRTFQVCLKHPRGSGWVICREMCEVPHTLVWSKPISIGWCAYQPFEDRLRYPLKERGQP